MKTRQLRWTALIVILAMLISSFSAFAAGSSPFVGRWEAIDVDGSELGLNIGGPVNGPFQINITDSFMSYCEGEPGLILGTGNLVNEDPLKLVAELRVECLTIDKSMDFQVSFTYLGATDTLVSDDGSGFRIVYRHPGHQQLLPEPVHLMVNYQEDWVSGFYEEGHTVWMTVTESDGISVKAIAEMVTGPQPGWDGGEIGFASQPGDWQSEEHDIVPGDRVYVWIDDGASAQMQVGEINAWVDMENDQVLGTISAPWYSEEVYIYCMVWGVDGFRDDVVQADASEEFSCSWSPDYDIKPIDVAEVQYYGPDGHAVDYYIFTPNPRLTVNPNDRWFEGYGWPDEANVAITVSEKPECGTYVESWNDFFNVVFPEGCDVADGNTVTFDDGTTTRTHTVQQLAIDGVDGSTGMVTGTADFNTDLYTLHAWIHGVDDSYMEIELVNGAWHADFSDIGLLPGMCGRVEINDIEYGNGTAADWCIPNPRFTVNPNDRWFEGYDWQDGALVSITVDPHPECLTSWQSWDGFFNLGFQDGCEVTAGNTVTFDDGMTTRTHIVQPLVIDDVDEVTDMVTATSEFNVDQNTIHAWIHEVDGSYMEMSLVDGIWQADFSEFDLQPGMCGRVEINDNEYGNGTAADWCIEEPPAFTLRVNYGHDWVESFYGEGYEVHIQVTDSEGGAKGTATAFIGPRDGWGGEPGFSTLDLGWDGDTPDLQPGDWVYAEVDNGISAQVQLGEILGTVDIEDDSVSGTIQAWIGEPVEVECLDWGSGGDAGNQPGGTILPDGFETYYCAWDPSVWDIQPWQEIGVGYSTPDGHWVANAFRAEYWIGVFIQDAPLWAEGNYSYNFVHSYSVPFYAGGESEPVALVVSSFIPDVEPPAPTPIYEGYALLRAWAQRAWTGDTCEVVDAIHPYQPTRFVWGWLTDFSMSSEDALAHFDSFEVTAQWNDGENSGSMGLDLLDMFRSDEWEGDCSLTEHP